MNSLNPKRLPIKNGYNGFHCLAEVFQRAGPEILNLADIDASCRENEVVPLETFNPTGLALEIRIYADIAHFGGAKLVVETTLAPPSLLPPFNHGAEYILRSASKSLSGRYDRLADVIVARDEATERMLGKDRMMIGTIMQPFQQWLPLRSLKTFIIRIRVQSRNLIKIAAYLSEHMLEPSKLVKGNSLNLQTGPFVERQHPLGASPTFAIEVLNEATAESLPNKLKLYHHTTSLTCVHSYLMAFFVKGESYFRLTPNQLWRRAGRVPNCQFIPGF